MHLRLLWSSLAAENGRSAEALREVQIAHVEPDNANGIVT
jgi:hypothetical protein